MIVCLLTDYGHDDDFVGVCHGVIRTIAPDAQIVDVSHGIPRFGVRQGALTLRNTLLFMPVGVHVAIVDPQVGTERRAIALRTEDGRLMVGPDNGLLSLAWDAAGGIDLAVDVTRSPHRLEPVSATFHGRDLFAPVAAQLAAGAELADAGDPLDPAMLTRLELPQPRIEDGAFVAHVLAVDRFGNASLNIGHAELAGTSMTLGAIVGVEVRSSVRCSPDEGVRCSPDRRSGCAPPQSGCAPPARAEQLVATRASTFADVPSGDLILYEDAYRSLALAINRGDAAGTLGIGPDAEVRLRPR